MNTIVTHRSLSTLALIALAAAGATACAGTPPDPEPSATTSSADTASCTATTSCQGILGAPPDIVVTCSPDAEFFFDDVSPTGTKTGLGFGTTWTQSMSDYAGSIQACQAWEVNWGIYVSTNCYTFSTYAPVQSWCPGGGSSSGGGTGSGGKRGCNGTCF